MSLAAGRGGGDEEPNKVTVTVELFVKRKASRYDKYVLFRIPSIVS